MKLFTAVKKYNNKHNTVAARSPIKLLFSLKRLLLLARFIRYAHCLERICLGFIISKEIVIQKMAYNVGRICAGVVFREHSARTNAWLKILLLMINAKAKLITFSRNRRRMMNSSRSCQHPVALAQIRLLYAILFPPIPKALFTIQYLSTRNCRSVAKCVGKTE